MNKIVFVPIALFCIISGALNSAEALERTPVSNSGLWNFLTKERSVVDPITGGKVEILNRSNYNSRFWSFLTKERSAADPVTGESVEILNGSKSNPGLWKFLTKERSAVDPVTRKNIAPNAM